jgi:hypothetical protein
VLCRLGATGSYLGTALRTLQPVDLIAQALVLLPQLLVLGAQLLDAVPQPPDDLPQLRVINLVKLELIKHRRRPDSTGGWR